MTTIADFLDLVGQLDEVQLTEYSRYTKLEVSGRAFGYLWQPTRTVGLKQTLAEQAALVGERPDVFEVQFTAGGFGWVVVYLDHVRARRARGAHLRGLAAVRSGGPGAGTRGPASSLIALLTSSVLEVLASTT